jgi:hypothetical protein
MKMVRLTPHIKENNLYQDGEFLDWIKYYLSNQLVKFTIRQNLIIILTEIKVWLVLSLMQSLIINRLQRLYPGARC